MAKYTSEETLCFLIKQFIKNLDELYSEKPENKQFVRGEKYAYVECLEYIQEFWEKSEVNGLDFDVEERYPLD